MRVATLTSAFGSARARVETKLQADAGPLFKAYPSQSWKDRTSLLNAIMRMRRRQLSELTSTTVSSDSCRALAQPWYPQVCRFSKV